MINSIISIDHKIKESDEIARQVEEYLARGHQVAEVPFGVGLNSSDTYRAYQSKLAKQNAAEKVAKEAGLVPKVFYSYR